MRYNYPCFFLLLENNSKIINHESINAKDFILKKKFRNYSLYFRKENRPVIWEDDNGYMSIGGRFWEDPGKDNELYMNVINADAEECVKLLKEINGYYSGIYYNKRDETLFVFADKLGFHNIYRTPDNSAFCNDLFTMIDLFGCKADQTAMLEHVILEYPIEGRTYFKNIRLIPPLTMAKCQNGSVNDIFYHIKTDESTTSEKLEHAYDNLFLKLKSWKEDKLGISLSMGKDSRALLYFLNKHKIPYDIFTFQYEDTHLEYLTVQKIASFLGKKALLAPLDCISNDEIIAFSGLPVFSNEFYRLGNLARQNNNDFLMLGYLGDKISGKLRYFREFGITNRDKFGDAFFMDCLRGVQKQSIDALSDSFKDAYHMAQENCRRSFEKYAGCKLSKIDVFHYMEHRGPRRTLAAMKYTAENVILLLPMTESGIFHAYLNLPHRLITSQQAHTALAAKDPSASVAHSIGLPIPISLSKEKYIRKLVQILNKIKYLRSVKEPATPPHTVKLTSETVRELLGKSQFNTTPKLAIRIRCMDEYYDYMERHYSERGILG